MRKRACQFRVAERGHSNQRHGRYVTVAQECRDGPSGVAGAYNHDLRGIVTHGGTLGTASQNAKTPARTQR